MSWNLRYAIVSYLRSTIWIVPVIVEGARIEVAPEGGSAV